MIFVTLRGLALPVLVALVLNIAEHQQALGATVTVNAVTTAKDAAQETVIVFDPLDASPPPTHEKAIIDQIHVRFVPRVSVMRTGTSVMFPNSDGIRHQVYSFSKAKKFSLKLYAGSPPVAVTFDTPGLVVLGCNIHDRMVGFVAVVDSPYFTTIPASGTATLMLPAGRYRMRVWNANLSTPVAPREVLVADAALNIPLELAIDNDAAAVAPWPE